MSTQGKELRVSQSGDGGNGEFWMLELGRENFPFKVLFFKQRGFIKV